MKRVLSILFVALLVLTVSVDFASAQRGPGGRGGGPGFGMMGGGGPAAFINDAFVLDEERAEEVEKIFEAAGERMMEGFSREDFMERSREERMQAFQERREAMHKELMEKLPEVLTEDEVEFLEPLLNMRRQASLPEISALRQMEGVEFEKETRGKLQTVVLIYLTTMEKLQPERGEGPPRGQRGGPPEISEEIQAKMDEAQETLVADIEEILNEEQIAAWNKKTEEIEKEIEERRQEMRERFQRGGQGRGGQRR